jgi:5-formyltetrahydrofolate cyclo-ligase
MRDKEAMDKKKFRKKCLARLRQIRKRPYRQKDHLVIQKLYTIIQKENAQTVLLYIPLKIEVDIHPLIRLLRQEGRLVLVPFMEGESFSLVKYRMPLERKQYGIREPKNSKLYRRREIDLAIVPIVGTDSTLRRVGFGKGMYDRFFEQERKNIKKTVFVSRVLCFSDQVVTDRRDVGGDMIITPETVRYQKKQSVLKRLVFQRTMISRPKN